MTDDARIRRTNAVSLALAAVAVAIITVVFLLLAYVDATLTRGSWRWSEGGWMVGVAVLAALAFGGTALAFRKSRYSLAWALVLTPLAAAVLAQGGFP